MDFFRESRITVMHQRMHKTNEIGAVCPLCNEMMESFDIIDANPQSDIILVDGACPVHGYVQGWTKRMRA